MKRFYFFGNKKMKRLPVPHSDIVEGPQPMEAVPQVEPTSTVDSQQVEDPPTFRFTWTIENFSRLNTKKLYSDVFVVGGYKWRVLIYPMGNNVDHLSMYLDAADSVSLPYWWSRFAHFSLSVFNQAHKYTTRKETQHQFNARESDWGFTSFMPLSELYDPSRGFLVNDTVVIDAEVAVYRAYDSKKETGFVGLKNQGTTSYMNSLLQTLYHIPYFRKAVYRMPTTESDMPSGFISLALQSLFYKLQYNDRSVATKELTKSFGWDICDSFMHHDVQELKRVLCEKLEDTMKGTVVEGSIQQLFEGHHMIYIECINVDYKSTRKESFYDLQLDVKGCRDVYASFDKYVEVDRLEGDNKYHTEGHGLQDAKKGVLFIDFPPVLQLQLKRFEYDFMRDTMVKINDRYEFPIQLDLDRDNFKYLTPEADKSVRNLYTLHSVLVHSGREHDGHYYAYSRPTLSEQWFKFDDERVTKEDWRRALDEQYGGEEVLPQTNPGYKNAPFDFTKYSNAYMLVYIRESDKDKIICNVDEKDIAEHLRIRLKKEQEEKEDMKKYKQQALLYTFIKVARNEDLLKQIGKDIYFDLVDHDKVRSFRYQKDITFNLFKEEVAKEFGVPVQFQRFWIWVKRQNHTYRPFRPLTPQEETQTVEQLRKASNKTKIHAELKLFLEVEVGQDHIPAPLPKKTKVDCLVFLKLYDPEKEELRYVGRLFVKSTSKPTEILAKLNEMAGFAPDVEIDCYEEIKFDPCVMCEPLNKRISFRLNEIENGDIICFQKSLPPERLQDFRYPDVPSFLKYVHDRQVVHFRALERPKEEDFFLELSKTHNYDDVVERVARKIGLDDPTKLRLTSHNCYFQQPKAQPIKHPGPDRLTEMLVHYNQTSDILYYEVLDIPLPELQGLKNLKVAFHHSSKDEVVMHNIRLPNVAQPNLDAQPLPDIISPLRQASNSSAVAAKLGVSFADEPIELDFFNLDALEEDEDEQREIPTPLVDADLVGAKKIIKEFCESKTPLVLASAAEKLQFTEALQTLQTVVPCPPEINASLATVPALTDKHCKHAQTAMQAQKKLDHISTSAEKYKKAATEMMQRKAAHNAKNQEAKAIVEEIARLEARLASWGDLKGEGQRIQEENAALNAEYSWLNNSKPTKTSFTEIKRGAEEEMKKLEKEWDDLLSTLLNTLPLYVGRLFVKSTSKPTEILAKLNEMAGFAPDVEIDCYEEIKFDPCVMCEPLNKRISFRLNEIEDGDIICFQKSLPSERLQDFRYPDVPSFLKYVHDRQVVHFRALERPKEEDFFLELSKTHNYDDVVERVARKIGLDDPSKLRLTSHNCYFQQPKAQPIKHPGPDRLTEMLVHYNQTSDILYYEVLDIPLPELQGLKNLKVAFHHSSKDEVVMHNIRLPNVAQPNLDAQPLPDIISPLRQASNSSAVAAKLGVSFADEPIELDFFNLDALEEDEDEQLEIPIPWVDADLVGAKKIIKEFCESKTPLVLASAADKLQFTEALQTLQTVVPCPPEINAKINASLATVPALTDKHSKHAQTAMQAQKKLDHISTSAEKYKKAATEMMQRKAAHNAKNQEAKAIVEEIARLEARLASWGDLKGEGQRIQDENAALNAEYSWLNNSKPTKTRFTEIKRGAEEVMKKLEKEWDDLLSTLLNTLPL